MSSQRVAFFFSMARRALENARLHPSHRVYWANVADDYRLLAKQTRAGLGVRRSSETISQVGEDSSGADLSF